MGDEEELELAVSDDGNAECPGHALHRYVVVRRPHAARRKDNVERGRKGGDLAADRVHVVRDHRDLLEFDAQLLSSG